MDHLQIIGQKEVEIYRLRDGLEQAIGALHSLKKGIINLDQIEIFDGGFRLIAPKAKDEIKHRGNTKADLKKLLGKNGNKGKV